MTSLSLADKSADKIPTGKMKAQLFLQEKVTENDSYKGNLRKPNLLRAKFTTWATFLSKTNFFGIETR